MMHREWNRVWTTVALVGLLPGLCLGIVATPAVRTATGPLHSWAA